MLYWCNVKDIFLGQNIGKQNLNLQISNYEHFIQSKQANSTIRLCKLLCTNITCSKLFTTIKLLLVFK